MNSLTIIETLSPDELQILQEKITEKRLMMIQEALKAVSGKLEKLEEKQDRTLEVAINSVRVKQSQYDYINQKEFGNCFTISIGSKTVGKLLKAVGLAQSSLSKTTPYRHFIPKYAKVMANQDFSAYVWHYENCLNFIDKWLSEKGHYEKFYSIETEKELEIFIDELYSKYI